MECGVRNIMKRKRYITAGIIKFVMMCVIIAAALIIKWSDLGFNLLADTGFCLFILMLVESNFFFEDLRNKEMFSEKNQNRLKRHELIVLTADVLLVIIMFVLDATSLILTVPLTAIEVYRAVSINLIKSN